MDDLWKNPNSATIDDLISAVSTSGKERDWERAVVFLWWTDVRVRFERAVFPPTETGGNSPTLAYAAMLQMLAQEFVPRLYVDIEAHRRALLRFRNYVPEVGPKFRPNWDFKSGMAKEAAQSKAKELVLGMADQSAKILELTAIPEYLENLKIYVDSSDQSPERGNRFRAANDVMWRIEEERQIKSGFAFRPRQRPNKAPEPTPGPVTPRAP